MPPCIWSSAGSQCLKHPSHVGQVQGCYGLLRPELRLCHELSSQRGGYAHPAREGLGMPPACLPWQNTLMHLLSDPTSNPAASPLAQPHNHLGTCLPIPIATTLAPDSTSSAWTRVRAASWPPCLHSGPRPRFSFHTAIKGLLFFIVVKYI